MAVAAVKWEIPEGRVRSILLSIGSRFVLIFPPKLYINIWVGKEIELKRSGKRKSDG